MSSPLLSMGRTVSGPCICHWELCDLRQNTLLFWASVSLQNGGGGALKIPSWGSGRIKGGNVCSVYGT